MRHGRRNDRRQRGPQIRVNNRIRAPEVRVIVGQSNQQLGVMPTAEALRKARSVGLDLVEVAAKANPPVCKIVDFGKYRYDLSKQEKDKKSNVSRLKEIKFRVNIDDHDYMTKIRHGEDFLDKGSKVRVYLQFRGRENAHKELGFQLLERVKEDLSSMAQVEMEPRKIGRGISMTLSPLPANRRKRRFSVAEEDIPDEETAAAEEEIKPAEDT